jgi:hypothetical protein
MRKPAHLRFIFVGLTLLALTAASRAQQAPEERPAPAAPAKPPVSAPSVAAPPAPVEIPAVVIESGAGAALLGKPVQSAKSEDLGRVVDVIVDRNGSMRAAVIDFGGFLGVGVRKIAVDSRALHFPENGALDRLIADLPRDQLKIAPPYKDGEPIVVIGAPPTAETVTPPKLQ